LNFTVEPCRGNILIQVISWTSFQFTFELCLWRADASMAIDEIFWSGCMAAGALPALSAHRHTRLTCFSASGSTIGSPGLGGGPCGGGMGIDGVTQAASAMIVKPAVNAAYLKRMVILPSG